MYDFGLRLQEMRKKSGLSQSQVASRLHLHSGTISAYENNVKTPSVGVLSDLALLYNTSTDYLLGHDNNEMVNLGGLSDSQKSIISSLILEFKRNNPAK